MEKIIHYVIYNSPLGNILLMADPEGLLGLWFEGQKHYPVLPQNASNEQTPVLREAISWLDVYFSGKIPETMPKLHPQGSVFQQTVWQALLEIPYGETTTYGALAKKMGVNSSQAVGGAVGRNPISILIPCHRVVGAKGSLTGYAGGIHRKQWLLEWERGIVR